jgi:hypothetical protein
MSRVKKSRASDTFEFMSVELEIATLLVETSQAVETFHNFQTQKVLTISTKILKWQSLEWKVSILKIFTKTNTSLSWRSRKSWHLLKVCFGISRNLNLNLDWSRQSRHPGLLFSLYFEKKKIRKNKDKIINCKMISQINFGWI